MSKNNLIENDLLVGNIKFEAVNNFKYLGVNVNKNNYMHQELQEVNERVMSENRYNYSMINSYYNQNYSHGHQR